MSRTTLLSLVAAMALVLVPDASAAQGCEHCWTAANGPNYVHAFTYSEPPAGYEMQNEQWMFEESYSPEHWTDSGHTYWLSGRCEDRHDHCFQEELASLVEAGDDRAVVEALLGAHFVEVDDTRASVTVECGTQMVDVEIPVTAWIMYRGTKELRELLTAPR